MALPLLLIIFIHLDIVLSLIPKCPGKLPEIRSTPNVATSACYVCLEESFPRNSPRLVRRTPGRDPRTVFEWSGPHDNDDYYAVTLPGKGCPAVDESVRTQFHSEYHPNTVNIGVNPLGSWVKHSGVQWYRQKNPSPYGKPLPKAKAWDWDASTPMPWVYRDKEHKHKEYPKIPVAIYLLHHTKGYLPDPDADGPYTPYVPTPCGNKQYAVCRYKVRLNDYGQKRVKEEGGGSLRTLLTKIRKQYTLQEMSKVVVQQHHNMQAAQDTVQGTDQGKGYIAKMKDKVVNKMSGHQARERDENMMDYDDGEYGEDWYGMDEGYYYEDDEGVDEEYYEDLKLYQQSQRDLKWAQKLKTKAEALLMRIQREGMY